MGIRTACRQIAAPAYFRRSLLFVPFALLAVACSENATEPVAREMDATPSLNLVAAQLAGASGPIVSGLAPGKCMDFDSNGTIINSCDGSAEQNFTFKSNGSIVASNGACVMASGTKDASRIILRQCDGGDDQKWTATDAGEIRGIGGKCIGVAWNNPTDGTKLVLWPCNSTPSQQWTSASSSSVVESDIAVSVSNLQVASGKTYKVLSGGTQASAVAYIDRTYQLSSSIPSVINGATYIRTANDDKFASLGSSSFLSFDVSANSDVYVAHGNDPDLVKPAWLTDSFKNTGIKLGTTKDGLTYTLYKKSFAKGRVTLGSNTTKATDGSMYLVFIVPQGGSVTDSTSTDSSTTDSSTTDTTTSPTSPDSGPHSGFFVSPSGSSSASGSESSPLSLSAALGGASGKIQPGDTVWLRKGTYKGNFRSTLSGSSSAPIVVRQYPGERATIDGTIAVDGRYTWYWGFEVGNTNTGTTDVIGVDSHCPGCRFINLAIHDHSGNGLGMWAEGPDQVAYGNIIDNNGVRGANDHPGHGIYAQNETGSKKLIDNILVNQFGYGVHIYGESGGLKNFTIDGNVGVNSGQQDGMDYQVGGLTQVVNLVFTDNMSYRSPGRRGNTARLGYDWGPTNSGAIITGNYLVGTLLLPNWSSMTFSGNTVLDGSMPTSTKVVVEPNQYEAGRANVIVYNWGGQGAVSVDLSKVLRSGDSYEVRNAANFYAAPVASGTYNGGSVSIPITSVAPARSISGQSTSSTGTEFNAYVVLRK